MKIGIVTVPYFVTDKQVDIAKEAYDCFTSSDYELYKIAVINNCRPQDIDFINSNSDVSIYNDTNCLSRAWNKGIKEAVDNDCEYIFIPNLDIVFDDGELDKLISFAESTPEASMWSMHCVNGPIRVFDNDVYEVDHVNSWDNFSCFLIKKDFVSKLSKLEPKEKYPGQFDEDIVPAYFEDIDMAYRMHLAGLIHYCYFRTQFFHDRNTTINFHTDKPWAQANLSYEKTLPYITEKWGGQRDTMTYLLPFNK